MLDQPELDNVFRALADPSRRIMLDRLIRGPATVTELARPRSASRRFWCRWLLPVRCCCLLAR